MPTIDINITGGTYKSRSRSLAAQKTQNMYPEIVDTDAKKSPFVLHNWPGLTLFGSVPGFDRGMFIHQGILYKVSGDTLYSIDQNGVHSVIGVITGSGRCVFEGIGGNLIIVSGGRVWVYNPNPDLTNTIYSTKKFNILAQGDNNTQDLTFGADGLNVYVVGLLLDKVHQYTLSVAWDVSTAGYSGNSLDVSSEDITPTGVYISNDGSKIYISGNTNDSVFQYDFTENYDLSTASYASKSKDISAEELQITGVTFSPSGLKMYIVGTATGARAVFQYDLTIGWDVSTAAYASKTLDVSSEDIAPNGLAFNLSGTVLYVVGDTSDTVYQYNLTSAYDLSTASYASKSLDVSSEDTNLRGLAANQNMSNIYVLGTFNNTIYQYSSTKEITDSDLESPNAVAHLNNQAIYDGDNARWCTSDVGDASSITAANYATAEASPDNLSRPYVFDQILYLFGEKTTETWYNSGVGNPPFDRIEGGIFTIGLAAIHSTAHNDNNLYFLGDDNKVYRLPTKQSVSDIALTHAIEGYSAVADAIGLCYSFENQNFYQLTFPSENKTWVYSEPTNQWIELLSGDGRYFGNSHAYAYRKNLIADYRNGNIYELDINSFDDNGTTVKRIRETGPIHGGLVGAPGKRVEMNRFELIMEVGVGVSAGQGIEPVVMLSYSDDGGKTFSTERWGNIGHLGDYLRKVEWHGLGSFESRIMRISMSDPVQLSIHSAAADIEVGI